MSRLAFINGLLGVILIVLGVGIWTTWARSLPPEPVVERTPPVKPATESRGGKGKRGAPDKNVPAVLPPAALVTAIVEKDLFDPSRQKQTEEAAKVQAVAKETGPPPGVSVVGIRILGKDREAFVTDQSQGTQQRRLRVGDQVGGYTVQQIGASVLTLTSPSGDPVTMALNVDKGHTGATPTKPGPPMSPRPGQPGVGQPAAGMSPAAGAQTAPSPAAGIGAKPPALPVGIPPRPPGAPTAAPMPGQAIPPAAVSAAAQAAGRLPPDAQEKLDRLKNHRPGRNR